MNLSLELLPITRYLRTATLYSQRVTKPRVCLRSLPLDREQRNTHTISHTTPSHVMSSSHKRHHDQSYQGQEQGDEEPWWERDRRGGREGDLNNANNSQYSQRYDDRQRYNPNNSSRGNYNPRGRGSNRGGPGYGGDRRPRDDYHDPRQRPQHSRGYSDSRSHHGYDRNGPPGRHLEDGE